MRRCSLLTSASCSCISTTMSVPLDPGLRQRTPHLKADQVAVSSQSANDVHAPARDQVVWGKTPSGQGARVPKHPLHLLVDTCLCLSPSFPRPDHARCAHSPLPSVLPKIAHRRHQPRPTRAPAHPLLHPAGHAPQDILLSLFRVLARRV